MIDAGHSQRINYAKNAYTNTKVNTASPVDLVIMLYDGAIDSLNRTSFCMSRKDYSRKAEYVSRATNIIGELASSLNMEAGKDVARNLRDLYFYMMSTIARANRENDIEKINHVADLLKNIRSAWQQIRQGAP